MQSGPVRQNDAVLQEMAIPEMTVPTVVQLDEATQVAVSVPAAIASDQQVLAALQEAAHRIAARLAARRRHAA